VLVGRAGAVWRSKRNGFSNAPGAGDPTMPTLAHTQNSIDTALHVARLKSVPSRPLLLLPSPKHSLFVPDCTHLHFRGAASSLAPQHPAACISTVCSPQCCSCIGLPLCTTPFLSLSLSPHHTPPLSSLATWQPQLPVLSSLRCGGT